MPECFLFPRVRIGWWTLSQYLTLLPHARDSLENKFMLSIPKGFPSPFNLTKSRIYSGTHFKEVLTNLFSKLPESFPFQDRQSRQECEHFATG